ncbi:unnamed protein product [Durusdinium trenchii]|uniref:MORN repeat-containing protein n=1 Tax=Durusdinium trenchii TaxID=1381693 RepID=A0ABP0M9D8_9DINO
MAKAKSEKSLASFLPASSAPGGKVGFADKVSALQPEVNTSKGKENVYVGFRNGQGQRDGFGVMQVEDGPTYTGQWSGSKREGHGTLFFETGVFEGQWVSGKAHGRGMVHFKNGDTFQGSYADNRKMGHGVYTWSDGTVESGQYLEGQKHGAHTWSRGKERWEMVYEKGTLVATQRLDQPDAAVPGATPAEGSAQRAEEGSPSREFVAQKWMTDEARVVPRPTPPPSPPKQPKPVQPGPLKAGGSSTVLHAALSASHASQTAAPSGAAHDAPSGAARFAAPSASWRCRSDSGFRAQGFTDEEIARPEALRVRRQGARVGRKRRVEFAPLLAHGLLPKAFPKPGAPHCSQELLPADQLCLPSRRRFGHKRRRPRKPRQGAVLAAAPQSRHRRMRRAAVLWVPVKRC